MATDYLRLVMYFFHPIQQCAQQIYHTALPLSPVLSELRSIYQLEIAHGRTYYVDSFLGAPLRWGLLLTTIDFRPRQLTCITTFAQKIVAAFENIVNIYDAVYFNLEQSLRAPESITKIQETGDGSILYLAHSYSVTSWDSQTGGTIDTFTTQSEIIDMVVSSTGGHIACGMSDGSVAFWNIRTMKAGSFGNGRPLVAIRWLSPVELVVATQGSVYVANVATGETLDPFDTPGLVWGTVILRDDVVLVGTWKPSANGEQEQCPLRIAESQPGPLTLHCGMSGDEEEPGFSDSRLNISVDVFPTAWKQPQHRIWNTWPKSTHPGQLTSPILVDSKIVCITPPNGVQAFDEGYGWIKRPSLLGRAKSVAVSLNRNLAVQTEDSVQVFPVEVLAGRDTQDGVHPPHIYIYPLGDWYAVCVQQNGCPTILELETLQAMDRAFPRTPPTQTNHPSSERSRESVKEFEVQEVIPPRQSRFSPSGWTGAAEGIEDPVAVPPGQSHPQLHGWTETAEDGTLLGGLSPNHTRIATVCDLPQRRLRVVDIVYGTILADLPLEDDDLEAGVIYHLAFDSETRFYLRVDGPSYHTQIPYDVMASPSGQYAYTIERGDPEPLSEPRKMPPYSLDTNYEWVLDTESRKICWVSPENIRRGNGGHFWAGLSLVMLGNDGVVRKLTFKDPNC